MSDDGAVNSKFGLVVNAGHLKSLEAQKKSSNEAAATKKVVSDAKSALELTEYMRLTTLKHKYKEDFAKSPLDFSKSLSSLARVGDLVDLYRAITVTQSEKTGSSRPLLANSRHYWKPLSLER